MEWWAWLLIGLLAGIVIGATWICFQVAKDTIDIWWK
jgi:hypothetical protein